jgi:hypothetical protein
MSGVIVCVSFGLLIDHRYLSKVAKMRSSGRSRHVTK